MKKILKIFLPVFVITIAVSLLFIPAEAEASVGGYAVWKDEAAFLAGEKPLVENKDGVIFPTDISGGGYMLAYGNITVDSSTNVQIENGAELVIDLNGYTLKSSGSLTVGRYLQYSPTFLTVKNGTLEHIQSQFFKPQHNSTTLLENLTINVKPSWGNFIYGGSFRSFTIKDSVLNYTPGTEKINACDITSPYEKDVSNLQAYAPEDEAKRDFEMNFVFDNSYFNTDGKAKFIYFRDMSDTFGYLQISFINGAGFNTLGEKFLSWEGTYDSWVNVNIEKGASFKEKEVPIGDFNGNASLFYYNSIDRSESGNYMVFGEKTSLAPEGHVNTPENKQLLIWGFSGDAERPHALCYSLYNVSLFDVQNNPIAVDTHGYGGFADGAEFELSAVEEKLIFKDVPGVGTRVFKTIQAGWSSSPERTNPTKTVTVLGNASYYAVATEVGPAAAVEFSSPSMLETDIKSAIFTGTLTENDLRGFGDGAYVKLYADVTVDASNTVVLTAPLTLDLGAHTLTKRGSTQDGACLFSVSGGTLNILSGNIRLSTVGLASVTAGGTVNLNGVSVTFDSYPAFSVGDGTVNMTGDSGSAIASRTLDDNVPAFLLGKGGADSTVSVSNTAVNLSGPFATLAGGDERAVMNITLTDCESFRALSVFKLYSSVSDNVNPETELNISIDGCLVDAYKVFDVAHRSDGSPAFAAAYSISESSFTSDPRDTFGGEVRCPDGFFIIETQSDYYKYSIVPSGIEMKFNLALSFDFIAKFYIKKDASLLYTETYLGRVAVSTLPVTSVDGVEYYVLSLGGISPSDALDSLVLSIGFVGADTKEYAVRFEYSPTDYFDALLNSTEDPLARRLSAAAMAYVKEAYEYSDCDIPEDFRALLLSEKYNSELRNINEIPTVLASGNLGNIANAFSGVQLYLSSDLSFRFNLRESFTGNIVISGKTYSVLNGKVGELGYIDVSPDAALWYSSSVVIGGDVSGEYSLMDYANSQAVSDSDLSELLVALYAYCYEAAVYTEGGVIPPYIEGTPAVDVTYR